MKRRDGAFQSDIRNSARYFARYLVNGSNIGGTDVARRQTIAQGEVFAASESVEQRVKAKGKQTLPSQAMRTFTSDQGSRHNALGLPGMEYRSLAAAWLNHGPPLLTLSWAFLFSCKEGSSDS
ncbi:uncharacterized protein CTRU02_211263 [Colletotrichum truncatum]|uniref:Uncharacterized protein n=1 Tax=Colletotrichum truncatum TaxID=5467 RepID=A0ACC3YRB6_COLTU|nr:uncharacterized protein CTRU02_02042 [Colletotrichum truncatum]KAF6799171.1 hypothetical protein CTRU02_02042 [Colletotrichum truncatum]